nr:MAG TPA: hypothetical protein [Caudoviricetes sp.]
MCSYKTPPSVSKILNIQKGYICSAGGGYITPNSRRILQIKAYVHTPDYYNGTYYGFLHDIYKHKYILWFTT